MRDGGVDHERTTTTSAERRDANGDVVAKEESSVQGSAGLFRDDDIGTGVRAGVGASSSAADQEGARSGSANATVALGDRGGSAGGEASGSTSTGKFQVKGNAGASASFTCTVEPKEGPAGRYWVVALSVKVKGHGGLEGGFGDSETVGSSSRVRASMGLSGSAERELTYRHRMSDTEKDKYLADLQRVSTWSGEPAYPELGALARLAAGRRAGFQDQEALQDPDAATRLTPGSSLTSRTKVEGTLQGGVGGNAGVFSLAARASETRGTERTIEVERTEKDGKPMVKVTVSFSRAQDREIGGQAGADGIGFAGQQTSGHTEGSEVVFELDTQAPDYRATFRRIRDLQDASSATALANELGAAYSERSEDRAGGQFGAGTLGDDGVQSGLLQGNQRTMTSTVNYGARKEDGSRTLSGTFEGNSTDNLNLVASGHQILRDESTTTSSGSVDAEGQASIQVDHEQTTSVPVVPEFLSKLLELSHSELSAFHLNDHEVEVLTDRARARDHWRNVLGQGLLHRVHVPWMHLSTWLVRPNPEASWVRADPKVADKLARVRAVVAFLKTVDADDGMACMERVLREWGEGSERLGVYLEFPEPIASLKPEVDDLHERVGSAKERFGTYTGESAGERIQEESEQIARKLRAARNAVETCDAFRDSGAKVETLSLITEDLDTIQALAREFAATRPPRTRRASPVRTEATSLDRLAGRAPLRPRPGSPTATQRGNPSSTDVLTGRAVIPPRPATTPTAPTSADVLFGRHAPRATPAAATPAPGAPAAPTSMDVMTGRVSLHDATSGGPRSMDVAFGRADATADVAASGPHAARIGALTRELRACKHEEQRRCGQAHRKIAAYATIFGGSAEIRAAHDALDAIDALFPGWTQRLDELDTLWKASGAPNRSFPWDLRPNVQWRIQLLEQAAKGYAANHQSDRRAKWQAQAGRWAM
jgi:hypothetical protein